jgi:hypothetical protein
MKSVAAFFSLSLLLFFKVVSKENVIIVYGEKIVRESSCMQRIEKAVQNVCSDISERTYPDNLPIQNLMIPNIRNPSQNLVFSFPSDNKSSELSLHPCNRSFHLPTFFL